MCRRAFLSLCATVMVIFNLVAVSGVYAKDLGPSINISENSKVQLLNHGKYFTIKVSGEPRFSGTFACTCAGNASGNCEVASITDKNGQQSLLCHKGESTTCKSSCAMSSTSVTTGSP